jgi:hypothetical protein
MRSVSYQRKVRVKFLAKLVLFNDAFSIWDYRASNDNNDEVKCIWTEEAVHYSRYYPGMSGRTDENHDHTKTRCSNREPPYKSLLTCSVFNRNSSSPVKF